MFHTNFVFHLTYVLQLRFVEKPRSYSFWFIQINQQDVAAGHILQLGIMKLENLGNFSR
jgi:hypothetical protein